MMDQLLALTDQSDQTSFESFHILLATLHSRVSQWVATRQGHGSDRLWFEFGIEITNGVGDPAGERLFYDGYRLSSEPTEASWDRHNESLVDDVVQQLGAYEGFPGLRRLFPSHRECPDLDEVLPGLPDHLWGWGAVEIGLQHLHEIADESEPSRRPGRPRSPDVQRRNQWIRKSAAERPNLGLSALLEVLIQESEEQGLGYKLTQDIVRNALRRR